MRLQPVVFSGRVGRLQHKRPDYHMTVGSGAAAQNGVGRGDLLLLVMCLRRRT